MTYLQLIFRIIAGGVLVYAGFAKAIPPAAEFSALIQAYKILPPVLTQYAAIGLPYVEMWIGLFVLFGVYTREAALAAAILFGTFLVALASTLVRGIDLASCGCFGADGISPKVTMVLDTVLLGLSIVIARIHRYPQKLTLDDILAKEQKKPLKTAAKFTKP